MSNTNQPGVTKYGYRRMWIADAGAPRGRRQVFEHCYVWEKANGPIPIGREIHHINGDKLDNRLENLELITRLRHKRLHSGCLLQEGQWWKPCRACGVIKLLSTGFYPKFTGNCVDAICKTCRKARATADKRRRREHGPKYRRNTWRANEKTPAVAGAGRENG